ncbi:MAG: hypothetical protein AB8H86_14330 [Polyangiales bacterium]
MTLARFLQLDATKLSPDGRLRFIALLLFPALIGHAIQLTGEDSPGTAMAMARYWTTPGWHLALPPWLVTGFALGLALTMVGLLLRRTRRWLLALIAFYVAHYFTYPFRIRNHMSMMLASLVAVGGVIALGRIAGLKNRSFIDRYAIRGVAMVLVITYMSASLHKMNDGFLGPYSSAIQGVDAFFASGGLGGEAPSWARAIAIYGTLVVEATLPLFALVLPRFSSVFVIALMLFHFPHVAVMNVADYPMIASTFYPALFRREEWDRLEPFLLRPSRVTLAGGAIGISAQLWFIPSSEALTLFGVFVTALWGWWSAAILQMMWAARRKEP